MLRADGIDVVVPLWRADAGNGGLRDSTKRSFDQPSVPPHGNPAARGAEIRVGGDRVLLSVGADRRPPSPATSVMPRSTVRMSELREAKRARPRQDAGGPQRAAAAI